MAELPLGTNLDFFGGGGEMGARMRAFDWANHPLGSPDLWHQSLRTTVRILLTTQHPMFIWWGPELFQFYNDAYSHTMGPERHPSALGQRGKDCWEEIWEIIGPQIASVMKGEGATWHEDQLVPVTRHGKREDVWWTYSFSPIDNSEAPSGVGGVLVVCNDITIRHRTTDALRRSEERLRLALEGGVIGTWDWHIQTDLVFADERFALLYGVEPAYAAAGAPIAEFLNCVHVDDLAGVRRGIEAAIATGNEFVQEYRLLQRNGHVVWVLARGRCMFDDAGRPSRFAGATTDITDRKQAEAQRNLLANELAHRVKNTLTMVQALAGQTLRGDVSLIDAREKLTARLLALSRAIDFLTGKDATGTEMRAIVATSLEPHAVGADRLFVSGPNIVLTSRAGLSLALALHELATNALKYGALSNLIGRVDLRWSIANGEQAQALEVEWKETGGPPVQPPKSSGFGSKLIKNVLSGDLNASVTTEYLPEGVIWRFSARLADLKGD